jgi:hypothetical protein
LAVGWDTATWNLALWDGSTPGDFFDFAFFDEAFFDCGVGSGGDAPPVTPSLGGSSWIKQRQKPTPKLSLAQIQLVVEYLKVKLEQ